MNHIQIRNVPDEVARALKARAALAGLSLSDYLRVELERLAATPSVEEFQRRLATQAPVVLPGGAEAWLRAGREDEDALPLVAEPAQPYGAKR